MNELTDAEVDAMFSHADEKFLRSLRVKTINRNDRWHEEHNKGMSRQEEQFHHYLWSLCAIGIIAVCGVLIYTEYFA